MGLQADFRADRKCIKTLAHTSFVPIVSLQQNLISLRDRLQETKRIRTASAAPSAASI